MIVELLEHVSLESHEYVNDILPTIRQSYKDVCSKSQFQYERPRLVHNSSLQDNVRNSCYCSFYKMFILGMLISFFPKIDYRFEKINFFSIIEFGRRYLAMSRSTRPM